MKEGMKRVVEEASEWAAKAGIIGSSGEGKQVHLLSDTSSKGNIAPVLLHMPWLPPKFLGEV